jgi:hypothetical protein
MTDHFEKTMADIAVKRAGNGGPKIEDVLEALRATNEDADETATALAKRVETTHKETRQWHEEIKTMVAEHIVEAIERDRRITNLELVEEDRRKNCIPEVKRLIQQEHEVVHANYVASLDEEEDPVATRSFAQILTAWSWGKKALAIIATALIIGITGIGVSYVGSLFATGKADSTIVHDVSSPEPAPTVTVTMSPTP